MAPEHDQIPEAALRWLEAGKPVALATVVETWGSAPRPRGSQLAISGEAEMVGSVSGGCVEGAVVAEALDALETGKPRLLDYGVSDDEAFAVGLACGGRIRVLVEPVGVGQGPSRGAGRGGWWRRGRRGRRRSMRCGRRTGSSGWSPGRATRSGRRRRRRWSPTRSGFADDWFLGVHNPPLRMAVVGAVHIAQALVPMARLAGYDVAVIDPREAFASPARFPDTRAVARLAGRGAGRVRAGPPDGGGDADPRPEARRPGDRGGAAGRGVLSRLPRVDADPRQAGRAAAGRGVRRGGDRADRRAGRRGHRRASRRRRSRSRSSREITERLRRPETRH